jgi:DNA-binding beta-propeller fold protein YncE
MVVSGVVRVACAPAIVAWMMVQATSVQTQQQRGGTPQTDKVQPVNSGANPYRVIRDWARLDLEARPWGGSNGVAIDRDGKSVWATDRCSPGTTPGCLGSKGNPVHHFDESGKEIRSFGGGMFVWPHGIHVDRDGNVWVTDWQDNFASRGRNAPPDTPLPPPPAKPVGHQIFKFSPEGKVLMTLGKPGGNRPGQPADPSSFYQPNDVITNDKGEIFVVEGHGDSTPVQRLSKFDRTGKFLKETGTRGNGPGQFIQPHGLAFDSKGRLFVADRSNNRIQIFDQDLNLLETGWEQYSRISGLWIDRNDMLYAADSESGSVAPSRPEWKRGIRIGSVRDGKDGKIRYFIPDPSTATSGTLAAEGVAVDGAGNVYGAEVGPAKLQKYVMKK